MRNIPETLFKNDLQRFADAAMLEAVKKLSPGASLKNLQLTANTSAPLDDYRRTTDDNQNRTVCMEYINKRWNIRRTELTPPTEPGYKITYTGEQLKRSRKEATGKKLTQKGKKAHRRKAYQLKKRAAEAHQKIVDRCNPDPNRISTVTAQQLEKRKAHVQARNARRASKLVDSLI